MTATGCGCHSHAQGAVNGINGPTIISPASWAEGEFDRLPELAAELVRRHHGGIGNSVVDAMSYAPIGGAVGTA
jgi:hypothetical protein